MKIDGNEIIVTQKPSFKKVYKKLHSNIKNCVDEAIETIMDNPKVGEEKKGDLAGIFVYKFKAINQEYLLGYSWDENKRDLVCLGVHENFYRDLKR